MITLAAWTGDNGSVSAVRGDLGHAIAYVDGTFHKSYGTHLSDDAAIEHVLRNLRWGAFGQERREYVREL